MHKAHNLDEGVREYFSFTIMGHSYKFRQPTTAELKELDKMEKDGEEVDYEKFITKVSKSSPSFEELSSSFFARHWRNFNKMVREEIVGE